MAGMAATQRRKLIGSGEAARTIGVDRTTLTRWASEGLVTPASRTAGGHLRWDIDQLKQQLEQRNAEASDDLNS